MSVLLRGSDGASSGKTRIETKEKANSQLLASRRRDKSALLRQRDTVRVVNETASHNNEEPEDVDSEAEKLSPLLDAATSTDSPLRPTPSPADDDVDEEEMQLKVEIAGSIPSAKESCNSIPPSRNSDIVLNDEEDDIDTVSQNVNSSSNLGTINSAVQPSGPLTNTSGTAGTGNIAGSNATGDDSDYYTPEDPMTTILSPLHGEKDRPTEPNVNSGNNNRWVGPRDGLSLPGTPLSTASHRSSGDSYSSSGSTRLLLSANEKTTHT